MTIVELHLDEDTFERAQHLAKRRDATLETLLKEVIESLTNQATTTTDDFLLGMFAQEPALIDEITETAMQDREHTPLRLSL